MATTKMDVYFALDNAAKDICSIAFSNRLGVTVKRGKVVSFNPPVTAVCIVDTMESLLNDTTSINDAMALLHKYEVMRDRYATRGDFKV